MWIRIFRTKREAERARKILEEGGFMVTIAHDNFEGVPIEKYGVPARFRLEIDSHDLNRAARYLAKKLKKPRK
jgi:hypothetical protein